ncbi:arsenate reductase (glutaredoxin) [Marinobacter sp. X15-166B]|uniref:arsenate reductase (glutaredoxin) n=1 Tax=Marinobacter sp. X15-166B TaxID=1897620 RepID=UPI00085BF68E|nr:arsenate reductase (glutaredoxin) [Marinobacter sp. X15-166B]OEY67824.1 arsenate reductase (glutaredoxin) [Marinobacter sp. X15-166B]
MTEPTRIFHNPRCSKSRQTLALLQERGISPEIILYLETPPTVAELTQVIKKLGCSAREVMRTKEDLYRQLGLGDESLGEAELIAAMVAHPKLIERPIVLHAGKAALGRPPENVLDIL